MIADLRPQAFGKRKRHKGQSLIRFAETELFLEVAGAKLRTPQPLCLFWLFAVVGCVLIAVAFSD